MPKNYSKYVLGTLDTVPASESKDGTIITAGKYVTGVGTKFKSDKTIIEGDWIFAAGDMRRIERIMSDESAYLEEAFGSDIAVAEALVLTKASRAREISLFNSGGIATTIDGQPLAIGAGVSFAEENWYGGAQRDFPDPLLVDGATSSVDVLIVY